MGFSFAILFIFATVVLLVLHNSSFLFLSFLFSFLSSSFLCVFLCFKTFFFPFFQLRMINSVLGVLNSSPWFGRLQEADTCVPVTAGKPNGSRVLRGGGGEVCDAYEGRAVIVGVI